MKHNIDLDELLQMCNDANAKEYLKEAIDCYKVGAYRSSIVATWIALVYNIIDKLRELGLSGDAQAAAQVKKFEEITTKRDIEEALKFERSILSSIQSHYEFITAQEGIELNRLMEDRNRCAHPNLSREDEIFAPTPEQARTHIRNAVEILLSRPPVQGKAALNFLHSQVDSEYFPVDEVGAYNALKISPVYRAKKNLIKDFLLGGLTSCLKEKLSTKKRKQRIVAMQAVLKLHPIVAVDIVKGSFETICRKLLDEHLSSLVKLLCEFSDLQGWLSDETIERVKRYVADMPTDDVAHTLHYSYRMDILKDEAEARYEKMNYAELQASIAFLSKDANKIPTQVIDKAVEVYKRSGNYNDANLYASMLIRPCIVHASKQQLMDIIQAASNGEVRESYEFNMIMYEVAQQEKLSKGELKQELHSLSIDTKYQYLLQ